MQLNPYLFFPGTCREAFEAYADILGARIVAMMSLADAPPGTFDGAGGEGCAGGDGAVAPTGIMHACLDLYGMLLMGSDLPPDAAGTPQGFGVHLRLDGIAQAERVFAALAEGGNVTMPLSPVFWADRFGTVTDRFGTPWMIDTPPKMG